MFELRHPFFNPLWRRIALTVAVLAWTGVEASRGEAFWAILFGAAGLYCAYGFFITWKGPVEPPQD